jgi:hypothetical protein
MRAVHGGERIPSRKAVLSFLRLRLDLATVKRIIVVQLYRHLFFPRKAERMFTS